MNNASKNKAISEKITERKKRIKKLWEKAHGALTFIYGDMPDVRILNRFLSEKMIFGNTDSIILWDLVSKIRLKSKEGGFESSIAGTDGSSFTAYLLGMCENPLPLHYLCPECKKTEFIKERALPWDMPDKPCECGCVMRAEGFDMPFEVNIDRANKVWPSVLVDPLFLDEAGEIVRKNMDLYRICRLKKHNYVNLRFVFFPFDTKTDYEESIDSVDRKYDNFSSLTIAPYKVHTYAAELTNETGVAFSEISDSISNKYLSDARVMQAFSDCYIDGIPEFSSDRIDMKNILKLAAPKNRYGLLKLLGALHGTNTWVENAERLIGDGICSVEDIPTQRDDVFTLLRDKLYEAGQVDTGIAYDLAMKIQRGIYARKGIPAEDRALIEYLDPPEWFIPYAERIQYMFPKAHNIEYLRRALAFMWYKINYPEAFKEIMTNDGL